MLKIEDLKRKAIMVEELVAWKQILGSTNSIKRPSNDLLSGKLMKQILGPSTQDFLAGNKIQLTYIYRYIDISDF